LKKADSRHKTIAWFDGRRTCTEILKYAEVMIRKQAGGMGLKAFRDFGDH
jgi:hypothetical protein